MYILICFPYQKSLNFQTENRQFAVLDARTFAVGKPYDSTASFFMQTAWFASVCIEKCEIFLLDSRPPSSRVIHSQSFGPQNLHVSDSCHFWLQLRRTLVLKVRYLWLFCGIKLSLLNSRLFGI